MAYHFDTPDRVLKRVQQLEDMELPSLPSFQHDDIDYDSMSNAESSRDDQYHYQQQRSPVDEMSQSDMATPHPLRKANGPPPSITITGGTRSSADSFSTASGSPFPPIAASPRQGTPSPYAPTTALTSTPQSHQTRSLSGSMRASVSDHTAATSKASRHERTQSGTGSLGNSTRVSRSQRWQTPGEMSGSFSGDEIRMKLGTEQSVPLNDGSEVSHSQSFSDLSSFAPPPEETPITRRLSSGNVLLERPRKRGPSAIPQQLEAVLETPSTPATPPVASSQSSVVTALPLPRNERIPSLSRSEVSGTDVSEAASTPEGPVRNVSMMTPRPDAHQEYEVTGEYQYNIESGDEAHPENGTWDYNQEHEYTTNEEANQSAGPSAYDSPQKFRDAYLPTKSPIAQYTTPGTVRNLQSRENSYDSLSIPTTVLHDVTATVQNTPSDPMTPSPLGMLNKGTENTTPRAPLDDAERRKSHVLAVLGSTGPTARSRPQFRGTPHPLRRVSTAPDTESIAEEGSDFGNSQRSLRRAATPGSTSRLTVDQTVDQSFVSVASSADLTTDKRASHMHSRLSRGNTSFPTILLPTGPSTPGGGSLKGLSDSRADGIKIHKHLNAMNKQLLESNADLAREAEAWRDEAERLRGILDQHGIEVEDVDVLGDHAAASTSANMSQQLPEWPIKSPSGRNSTKGDHSELISQLSALNNRKLSEKPFTSARDLLDGVTPEEYVAVMEEMAEKLESLEEGLNEKDEMIANLQDRIAEAQQSGSPELIEKVHLLSTQLEEAENARIGLHAEFSAKTELHAKRFGEICTGFEDQVKALEKDLSDARAESDRLRSEKSRLERSTSTEGTSAREHELRKQIHELEVDLQVSSAECKKRLTEVDNLKHHSAHMLEEKEGLMQRVEEAESEIMELRNRIEDLEEARDAAGADAIDALKDELRTACEAQSIAEDSLARLDGETAILRQTASDQELQLSQQQSQIEELNHMVEGLEADLGLAQDNSKNNVQAEEEVFAVRQELQKLNVSITEKEAEIEMLKGKLGVANIAAQALRTSQRRSTSPNSSLTPTSKTAGVFDTSANQDSFVVALEERLDEAYREIGRLKHDLNATPHRRSALDIRDAKIQALEREKAALADRLASGRGMSPSAAPTPAGVKDAGSPFKRPTPLVHRAITSLRTPRTPGPLGELSWLQTTIGDANEPVLQAQLEYLQEELRGANDQLDRNFSRLESAGLGAVALAEKLAAAEERIGELEDEIRALLQRNKASLALVSADREERERENEGRTQRALEAVHLQMEELKSDIANERSRIQRDNGRLQDLVSEMRLKSKAEVDSLRAEMDRAAEAAEDSLKSTQDDMSRVIREREGLLKDMQSQKTRITQLESDVAKEQRAYESLSRRTAQSAISAVAQADLAQKKEAVRSLQATLSEARAEEDRLRDTLSQTRISLEQAQSRVARYESERQNVLEELEVFERDLQVQRAESEEFGHQLQALKREQSTSVDKHRAELRGLERELRLAKENEKQTAKQLEDVKKRHDSLEHWKVTHECDSGTSQALIDQKAHFKAQSRSLASQIRYLKAKFTRESTFRNALTLQKRYLLLLVGGMSLDQQATLRAIAKMGYPVPEPPRPKRTLKAVALAIMGVIRAKNSAAEWKKERELKANIPAISERRRVSART
uniref:Pericentrin/AKAP-450 centrosomal targeting domain-containing protein n=1 Tax=Kwoniella dejecticola CBS 10117 TaxID=1296121 RepID=A0A1A5ZTQ8_9TREE|nr:uncharacterized protein I303_08594 [Kwoniella dejecticola CBS 10117]OBR81209.1 hypothetical protein I303_08594 [Kwoniella dejecticola CBS 10117]